MASTQHAKNYARPLLSFSILFLVSVLAILIAAHPGGTAIASPKQSGPPLPGVPIIGAQVAGYRLITPLDLLFGGMGATNSSQGKVITTAGRYVINITADGTWTLKVERGVK